jgi:hypothetical protein
MPNVSMLTLNGVRVLPHLVQQTTDLNVQFLVFQVRTKPHAEHPSLVGSQLVIVQEEADKEQLCSRELLQEETSYHDMKALHLCRRIHQSKGKARSTDNMI